MEANQEQHIQQQLSEALQVLLTERSYQKVTVTDISERADISRPSFYLHFDSKDDLLLYCLDRIYEHLTLDMGSALRSQPEGYDFSYRMALRYFNSIDANYGLYKALVQDENSRLFQHYKQAFMENIIETLIGLRAAEAMDTELKQMVASYYAGATLAVITQWINRDRPYPPETMAEILLALGGKGFWELMEDGLSAEIN